MACVQEKKNKDGSVSYLITVSLGRDAEGKKQVKRTTFIPKSQAPTKAEKEANEFAVEFENQIKNGDIVADEKMTLNAFVKIWEQNWLPAKTPTVRENYLDVLRVRVLPFIGNMKIPAIRATHIDKIIKAEKDDGKAPKTVRMTFTVINSVFKYAVKKQYVRENPCLRCDDLPPVTMKTGNDLSFFNEDQTKRFLKDALTMEYEFKFGQRKRINKNTGEEYAVKEYKSGHSVPLQWRIYFMMAIYGGFRRGEMCALTWRDADFDKHVVSISKAAAGTKDGQIIKDPKTKAGIRDIVLPAEVFDLLKQWKKEQLALCVKLGTAWKGHRNGLKDDRKTEDSFEDNNIFIQIDNGLPVNLSTPGHKFAEIIDLYNRTREREEDRLPKIRLHDLRHTSATLLLAKDTDIETVSRRLGHSKASVTLDIYGHALPENDKKAAAALESMFG